MASEHFRSVLRLSCYSTMADSQPRGALQHSSSLSQSDLLKIDGTVEAESTVELNGKQESSVLQKLQKWADYENYGGPVRPTKFLPMKTPMSSEIIRNWSLERPPQHVLTIQSLCTDQTEKGRTIGLILDLSNHETLYAEDLQTVPGLQYVHIPVSC